MTNWSRVWNLFFNTNKFIHLSFNSISYFVGTSTIQTSNSHRDLGIIILTNSSWKDHYNHIIAKTYIYRTLGLLRQTLSHLIDTSTKKVLYLALVRSQLLYWSPIWHPYVMCDITALERIQRRATKYILNDYSSNYRTRLLNLNMLPLMYILMVFVTYFSLVQHPFNINNYVSFYHYPTRSSTSNKLQNNFTSSTKLSNFYFNRLPRTYNSLPVLDLNQPFHAIKAKLHKIFWQHFSLNFDSDA